MLQERLLGESTVVKKGVCCSSQKQQLCTTATHFKLLLVKQALQKRRGWCSTIFEMLCPAASVLIMVILFMAPWASVNTFVVGAKAGAAFTPVGTMQVTDVRASSFAELLIPWSDLNSTTGSFGAVPLSDFPNLIPEWNTLDAVTRVAMHAQNFKIALAPSDHPAFAAFKAELLAQSPGLDMSKFANEGYPNLKECDVPGLSELVRDFESEAAIEAYVTGANYPLERSAGDRIFAAIVLEDGAPHWKYAIRTNGTTNGAQINLHWGKLTDPLVRGIEGSVLSAYVKPTFHEVGMEHVHLIHPPHKKGEPPVPAYIPSAEGSPTKTNFGDRFTTWGFSVLQVAVDRAIIGSRSANPLLLGNKLSAAPCAAADRTAVLESCINQGAAAHQCCTTLLSLSTVLASIGATGRQYGAAVSKCKLSQIDAVNASLAAMFAYDGAALNVQSNLSAYHRSGTYAPHGLHISPMSTESYSTTFFWDYAAQTLAIFFVLSYVFPTFRLIRGLVYEKESGVREGLRMMGVSESALVASWVVAYLIQFTIVAAGLTFLTCVPFLGKAHGNLFAHSDPFIIFIFYELFGLATTCFCYFVHVFFSRARTAATLGAVFWLAAFFPYFAVYRNRPAATLLQKLFASLLPPTAIGLGLDTTSVLEASGAGVTWETLWTEYYSYSFGYALLFLLFDSFLFLAAAWYLDRVWPHAQGQRLAPWFCVLPSYWRPKAYNNCTKKIVIRDEDDAAILNKEKKNVGENFEVLIPEQERLVEEKRSVAVRGLRKEFGTVGCGSAVKVAVDGLEMTLVEGEIFVLLGHNGAGKTTTISMLTGLLPLTSGKASILGRDISTDMIAIRKSLGVCPQQNVLFDDLTVIEHLSLYGGIKGLSPAECRTQGYERLKDVALEAKVYSLPSQLSGGQKRKLCLAISMMGDSKVLFLDEPTSGMDVFAQRSTWNLLQKSKAGRIIVLTTHSMDEADIIGDRIGIMANGAMVCCGSPMFLKSLYGVGYSLTVTRDDTADDYAAMDERSGAALAFSASDERDERNAAIADAVKSHVANADTLQSVGRELVFKMPLESAPQFEGLFNTLDTMPNVVANYGVSVTTMEEVFLSSARQAERVTINEVEEEVTPDETNPENAANANEGEDEIEEEEIAPKTTCLFATHFQALWCKRMQNARRDFKALFFQLVIPLAVLAIAFSIIKFTAAFNEKSLDLSLKEFNKGLPKAHGHGTRLPVHIPHYATPQAEEGGAQAPGPSPSATMRALAAAIRSQGGIIAVDELTFVRGDASDGVSFTGTSAYEVKDYDAPFPAVNGGDPLFRTAGCDVMNCTSHSCGCAYCIDVDPNWSCVGDGTSSLGAQSDSEMAAGYCYAPPAGQKPYDFMPPSGVQSWVQEPGAGSKNLVCAFARALTERKGGHRESTYLAVSDYYEKESDARVPRKGLAHDNWQLFLHVNTSALHGVAMGVNVVDNALLRLNRTTDDASISVSTHPLPLTMKQRKLVAGVAGFFAALIVMLGFAFIPASFAELIVKERECEVKHQQLISGVSLPAYWISTLCWDLTVYSLLFAGSIAVLKLVDVSAYTAMDHHQFSATCALFALYGGATAGGTYIMSYFFKTAATAINVILLLNVMLTVLLIACFIMSLLPGTCAWEPYIKVVFMFFPNYVLGDAMLQISNLESLGFLKLVCEAQRDPTYVQTHEAEVQTLLTRKFDAFDWDAVGLHCTVFAIEFVVYFTIALLIDVGISFPKLRASLCGFVDPTITDAPFDDDVDIVSERSRMQELQRERANPGDVEGGAKEVPALAVSGLRKVFRMRDKAGKKSARAAVVSSWFGVRQGEVFGLLGVNGAGKSTTLKMLSGDLMPTEGTAEMCGNDILTQQLAVRRLLGYCPQHNALLPLLTVEEHLQLFARIKGVRFGAPLRRVVAQKMRQLDLTGFRRTQAGNLSGGNKRKLCVGIALIGNPRIIFLDEPSAGMDPVAKRFMWDLIMQISNGVGSGGERTTVVLTTHSMEECSALCDRMCIMVDGRLRCLGSEQHLKTRYGRNLQAQIKLSEPTMEDLTPLVETLMREIAVQQPIIETPPRMRSRQSSARRSSTSTNGPATTLGSSSIYPMGNVTLLPSVDEAAEALARCKVTAAQIEEACEALGQPDRAQLFRAAFAEQKRSGVSGTAPSKAKKKWFQRGVVAPVKMAADVLGAEAGGGSIEGMAIASGESGSNPSWLLAEEFSRAGWVNGSTFARWWLLLDWSEALDSFLADTFNRPEMSASGTAGDSTVLKIEQHDASVRFAIPKPPRGDAAGCGIGLGSVFGRLESAKAELRISSYSVSQTNLDQIFVDFARTQMDVGVVHT